ncbi:MAG: hypothetical protein EOP49_44760, partial [Sphingobacteriales bacterium]
MKKTLTLLGLGLLTATAVQAQITINQSSFAGWSAGTDSVRYLTNLTALPALPQGPNQTWDLSSINFSAPNAALDYNAGTNAAFPGASFSSELFFSIGAGIDLTSNIWWNNAATSLQQPGETMIRQAYGLGAVTMTNTDSLVFPNQINLYSTPRTVLQYPATFGTNWATNYVSETDFQLTVAAFGLNQAPGSRISYNQEVDTVIGWGKMRLKNAAGTISGYMDVIQVKTHVNSIDSFYINGSPAPATMLSAFGLTQGMETDYFSVAYYRVGEITPLLEVYYNNSNYTSPSSVMAHMLRHATPNAILDVNIDAAISTFPNPVTTGMFQVTLPESTGSWTYELLNTLGQVTASGSLEVNGKQAVVATGGAASGTYY